MNEEDCDLNVGGRRKRMWIGVGPDLGTRGSWEWK